MRRFTLAAAALILAGCGTDTKTVDATAEFKPKIEKVAAAWHTLDIAKVAPFYAKDAGLAFFDVEPLKYTGWREYEEGSRKTMADWKSLKLVVNPDLKAYKHGDIAWATYTMGYEVETKTGETTKAETRVTDLFEKRGEDWLMVHEHTSVPWVMPAPAPAVKHPARRAAKKAAKTKKK
jgi:ketosteroid isomerase-like protein